MKSQKVLKRRKIIVQIINLAGFYLFISLFICLRRKALRSAGNIFPFSVPNITKLNFLVISLVCFLARSGGCLDMDVGTTTEQLPPSRLKTSLYNKSFSAAAFSDIDK